MYMSRVFAAIDLKSFYASVECNERGLDPLTTNLVVADKSRTDKTICLAISPSLKSYGLPGRARLFQVNEKVHEINAERQAKTPLGIFLGKSTNNSELLQNPNLALDFIIAPPRMKYYLDYSSKIYNTYLQHVAPEDIFAYSIDEIFCDITSYLKMQHCTAEEFVTDMITDVYQNTGITATAGIGTNMYLAKIAMDIMAKHAEPNSAGVRIAKLNEQTYRKQLWTHTPITDFWRVGRGYAKRLTSHSLYTMGDIARCSLQNPKLLYDLFGINAELLIDHAWGYECVTIPDVKQHIPKTKSLSSGQVLSCPYSFTKARTIVKEMAENLALELVQKGYLTNHLGLYINYDHENQSTNNVTDHYGRHVPKPMQGTTRLDFVTSSAKLLIAGFLQLYDEKVNPKYTIRKITVTANDLIPSDRAVLQDSTPTQADFFTNYAELERQKRLELQNLKKEHRAQKAVLDIRKRYGKNSILRGFNFEDGATGRSRHQQIGGHRAWAPTLPILLITIHHLQYMSQKTTPTSSITNDLKPRTPWTSKTVRHSFRPTLP